MSNASWTPDEPADVLFSEKTWLQGAILTGVGYGIVFTLFTQCFRALLLDMNRANMKRRVFFLIYITIMFILGTIFMAACAEMTQLSFIQYRNYPTGPSGYENDEFSIPADEAGNVAFVLTNWFADALLVWRCSIIFRGVATTVWIPLLLPVLMYLTELAMGLLWLVQISTPASSPFQTGSASKINWTVPYFSIAVSLNVVVTLMIAARLWLYRYRITSVLGMGHGSHYTGIAAMIVESAAIYSTFALLFIIPFGVNNSIANTFLQALSQVQIIAPLLIIYRVARGKGWTSDTSTAVMSGKTRSTTFSTRNNTSAKNLSGSYVKAGPNSFMGRATDQKGTDIELVAIDDSTVRGSVRPMRYSEPDGGGYGEAV
ncbi:uncharacterized protein C8Q71DRAFT_859538 [Rhodofomes roseus]|uniref:Uncharacterized protein n=1 Tax=Rhodofomes roseus TaxID=34475 RepID=A0A4Y9Z351_9APHY|nr:uncharacterized protein C8Q71DRAFT_859538 [Rhodofomes roseus]KAH9834557.1 hypothetical protein C8Q71DRAFT_859538 [Rhodofomes roseus]TFY68450.1 hypothetical protein EVJ58_g990 [Rhodofomes roseus]